MAYSTIDKSSLHFNTVLYTGNGGTQSITGVGFQPDWTWIKSRSLTEHHNLYDAVRGVTKPIYTNLNYAEGSASDSLTAFGTDGFSIGANAYINTNSATFASWNWKAGGASPAITYVVKVVSDSGNKYRFDDFGTSAVTLDLQEGGTYTFDQADSSNSGHPLRFYTASDKTGGEYTTGVTTTGTPGSAGAKTVITVAASAPTLYYQCSSHAGMGGQANTNSTFGSSNFSGSIQSTVSVNNTAGFSIVKYTGNGGTSTVGHGMNVAPTLLINKNIESGSTSWFVGGWDDWTKRLKLEGTNDWATNTVWNDTAPTNQVFSLNGNNANSSGQDYICYCFAEKAGYSKFGTLESVGNDSGTFSYCGFAPQLVMVKPTVSDGWSNWYVFDRKRDTYNLSENPLFWNLNTRENYYGGSPASNYDQIDITSTGFKIRRDGNWGAGASGTDLNYMAFGQTIVGSNNVAATAR